MADQERTDTEEVEIWKPIEGYEEYYHISSFGRVKSLARVFYSGENYSNRQEYPERIRKLKIAEYIRVGLCVDAIHKEFTVHVLVAKAFIPNPENKPVVNHLDGDKHNNHKNNLAWATESENVIHAIETGLIVNPEKNLQIISRPYELNGRARKVYQFDYVGNFIRQWNCIKEAADFLQVSETVIRAAASGNQNHAGGFVWSFDNVFPGFDADPKNGFKRAVLQFDMDGNYLNEFSGIAEAGRTFNIHRQNIGKACLGKYKSAGGYKWEYK